MAAGLTMTDLRIVNFWLSGQPPRKSNARRIFRSKSGKPMIVKSKKALAWMESALWEIPALAKLELGSKLVPVSVVCQVYYKTRLPDLSIELILDLLEKGQVISNDRWVYSIEARKDFSKEYPGVYVRIKEIDLASY
jgi:Holliday junction resolvase RusA-like endonuclease